MNNKLYICTTIHGDIAQSKNPVSETDDVKHHFTRDMLNEGKINVVFGSSEKMALGMLTMSELKFIGNCMWMRTSGVVNLCMF